MKLKENIFWNTFGTIVYLGAQWLTTILVVRISADYAEAGLYSLAMSITNIFYIIAIYNVRNFQVSDIRCEFSNEDYLSHRISVMILAFLACLIFVVISYNDVYKIGVVLVYMGFRLGESLVDVFHGIDQKKDRMDIVGKSYMIRGIILLGVFSVCEFLFKNIFITICGMAISTFVFILVYDIRSTKKIVSIGWKINVSQIKKLFVICFPLLIYGLALNILASLPRIITENMYGSELLGYYASVATPAVIVQSVANVFFAPFITTFTKYYEERKKAEFTKLAVKMIGFCVILGVVAYIGSFFLGEWVLDGILYRNTGIGPYCYLLNTTMICTALVAIIWFIAILLTIDRATIILSLVSVAGTLIELVTAYILIKNYGLDGINWSLIISYLFVIVFMSIGTVVRMRKHFGEK